MNIFQDKEEVYDQLKYVCMHIQPGAFKDELMGGEETVSTDFLDEIEKGLGRPLTREERSQLAVSEPISDVEDVDVIESVNG